MITLVYFDANIEDGNLENERVAFSCRFEFRIIEAELMWKKTKTKAEEEEKKKMVEEEEKA